MDVKGKKVAVIGLGRSGVAAVELLCSKGATVVGSDLKRREDLILSRLEDKGVQMELGANPLSLLDSDLIVVSPGVPPWAPILREADRRGHEVVAEIELASWFLRGELVGVTGTNGKTTTVALLSEILKAAGRQVLTGGNIHPGTPLSELACSSTQDHVVVCEVSTFQLERVKTFRPKIGVLLNVSPDHLDRHKSFENYLSLKGKLFANQQSEDFAVLNREDPWVLNVTESIPAQRVYFSRAEVLSDGAWLEDGAVFSSEYGSVCRESELTLRGGYWLEDVLASVAVAAVLGVERGAVRDALKGFRGVVHRMEDVDVLKGVRFVNNSMCTNPASFTSSLDSFREPLILICGGKEKGTESEEIVKGIKARGKAGILIGESGKRIEELLRRGGYSEVERAETMEEAVREAFRRAAPGDVVLLSPGFASFDMFRDFAHRGEEFKNAVRRLRDEL